MLKINTPKNIFNLFVFVNKPLGKTPKQIINNLNNKNYFHTGTLDVMATGLIMLVSTKLRPLEKFFKQFNKQYEFEVITGFSTDTHDLLGLITSYSNNPIKKLNTPVINSYTKQVPPKVSYKNLNSLKKLNNFLNGGNLKSLRPKQVKIKQLQFLGKKQISKGKFKHDLFSNINKVEGEFRQKQIIQRYNKNLNKLPDLFTVYKYKITVSSGFYVRAFVRDLAKLNNFPLCTYSIKRTCIGLFCIK